MELRALADARLRALAVAALLSGCGYRPLHHGLAGRPRIQVVAAEAQTPAGAGADVAEELASGARAELARYGALGGSESPDRLSLQLVRLDDASEGIAVADARPHARGIRLRVIARGVVRRAPSGGAEDAWETADVETSELVPSSSDPLAWDAARRAAARMVARKAGALVAREVLGVP